MKLFFTMLIVLNLTACGTIAGAGNDIAGAANWTKEKMSGSKSK